MEIKTLTNFEKYSFQLAELHKKHYLDDHLTAKMNIKLLNNLYLIFNKKLLFSMLVFDESNYLYGFIIIGKYPSFKELFIKSPTDCILFAANNFFMVVSRLFLKDKFISSHKTRLISIVCERRNNLPMAKQLEDFACKKLRELGIKSYGLSVTKTNKRAINFYKKQNFEIEHIGKTKLYLFKNL